MDTFESLWEEVKKEFQNTISETVYKVWLKDLQFEGFEDGVVTLSIAEFKRKIIASKFMNVIEDAFLKVFGFEVEINLIDAEMQKPAEKTVPVERTADNTFDSFVVGPSNRFAHAAALAVANNPGSVNGYNPLLIWGPSGMGKTHLLSAIGKEIKKNFPDKNVLSITGESMTNELVDMLARKERMSKFHDKYRTVDVLLVDDIQFIAGKVSTEEEFFHTFNALYDEGKQIVLTSDRPPKEMKTLEERVRNRLEWGLIADIQLPDLETRMAIVKRKADMINLELSNDVILFLAEKLKNNIRQLEGAVKKVQAYVSIYGSSKVTVSMAQSAIKDILNDNRTPEATFKKIVDEVARVYGINSGDILSKKQTADVSKGRQVSMYIVGEMTGMSATEIGSKFGGKDHSTVLYSIKKVREELSYNQSLQNTIDDIMKNVENE